MSGTDAAPLVLPDLDEQAMARFGETLAMALVAGDTVWLEGDLGAGKTALARAVIRAASGDAAMDVPSPTFSLVQHYDAMPFGTLLHADLYRLDDGSDVSDLAFEEVCEEGALLVEWPQRAGRGLPEPTLTVSLTIKDADTRTASLTGPALPRVARSHAIRGFLDQQGLQAAARRHLTGDASARSYETISTSTDSLIVMNAPAMPDGPAVAPHQLPYSQLAHLAENIRAFVAVDRALAAAGFVVPPIVAADLDQGFLLIGDLGSAEIITPARAPIPERYEAAVDCLVALHGTNWPDRMPVADGEPDHQLPHYSKRALLAEVGLLLQWYAPEKSGGPLSDERQRRFNAIWDRLTAVLEQSDTTLVLRDFHSPNIIWQDDAAGTDRIGLIDFQDAVCGPCAYDLASLAQDARVDVPEALEERLVARYMAARSERDTAFDAQAFGAFYAIMAAQRATKIAGIFVRLSKRDGKHGYLQHLPRIEAYLAHSLRHPALSDYADWWREVFGA